MSEKGTPRTLNEAIRNAVDEYNRTPGSVHISRFRKILKNHILDWNRQSLAVIVLSDGENLSEKSRRAIERLGQIKLK